MLNINYFYNSRNFVQELHSALTFVEKKVLFEDIVDKKILSRDEFMKKNKIDILKYLEKTPAQRAKVKKYNDNKNYYKHYLTLFSFMQGVLSCINVKIICGLYEHGSYRNVFSLFSELKFPIFNNEILKLFFKDFSKTEDYINNF